MIFVFLLSLVFLFSFLVHVSLVLQVSLPQLSFQVSSPQISLVLQLSFRVSLPQVSLVSQVSLVLQGEPVQFEKPDILHDPPQKKSSDGQTDAHSEIFIS